MNRKTFIFALAIIFVGIPAVLGAYATYQHSAFKIGDGKDIDLNGQAVGNGTTKNLTCSANCSGFNASQIKIGTFTYDTSTASGNQVITGVGFQPTLVYISGSDSSSANQSFSGFSNGSSTYSTNNYGNVVSEMWITAPNIALFQTPAIYVSGSITFQADGFTIAWTKTGGKTGTADIIYTAIR